MMQRISKCGGKGTALQFSQILRGAFFGTSQKQHRPQIVMS
jgi:hypothetical protein